MYCAYSNGTIHFNNFFGTRKFCTNNKDSQYVQALTKSSVYVKSGNKLTLKDAKG
jgi:heat shock protein HslJ